MKRTAAVLAILALACGQGGVSKTVTFKAKGLYLSPSDVETPDGALAQADNVVIARDGIVETRRGQDQVASRDFSRLFSYKGALVSHDGDSTLYRSTDSGVNWTAYTAPVAPSPGYPLRAVEMQQNLFLADGAETKRIDTLTGTPAAAGVPAALDVDLTLSSAGSPTALPNNKQVAYRVLFGKKDTNGRLILGAPSGRAVVTNTAGATRDVTVSTSLPQSLAGDEFIQVYRSQASVDQTTDPGDELGLVMEGTAPTTKTATALVRASGSTVTAAATAHGFVVGQTVRVSPGGSVGGVFCAVGSSAACATSPTGTTWTGRTIDAGTYYGVAWNGTAFAAVGNGHASTSPDGTTWTDRTIPAGNYYGIAWNSALFAAVGDGCSTSPDGTTWTARTIPTTHYMLSSHVTATIVWSAVTWTGTQFIAVGSYNAIGNDYKAFATSPDGITWTDRTPQSGDILGAPASVVWTGSQAVAVGVDASWTSSDGITWTTHAMPTGSYKGVAWSGSTLVAAGSSAVVATSTDGATWVARSFGGGGDRYAVGWNAGTFVAVGTNSAYTSTDGTTWASRTITAGTYRAVAASGALFPAGEKIITAVGDANHFSYAESGTDATLTANQTVTPRTATFLDTVPDGFIGASLYTNANQEGILNANERPPVARDLAEYKGSLFLAHVTTPAYGVAYLLAVGGSNGLQANDTVTINGVAYTAKASETIASREFKVYTTGSVSQNIRDTAASLIRVVNRAPSVGVTVTDISSPDDFPGQLAFKATDCSSSLTVTFSRSTAWSPTSLDVDPKTHKNGFVWSKSDQPDSFATSGVLLPTLIGSADKEILRVIATRSSLFFLKEDGVWRLTGTAGAWDVQPFDPTIRVVAPETAVVLDNTIWALTDQGVVRIADSGVGIQSDWITSVIQAALSPTMRSVTKAYAFGVAYESDHRYLMWLPEASDNTHSTNAYTIDYIRQGWTRRTDHATHAIVNPADDRLYTVDGTYVTQERKDFADTDLQDYTGTAIATFVKWSPHFGGSPMDLAEFQEVSILWDRVKFTTAMVGFATNLSTSPESVTLSGSDYACNSTAKTNLRVVVWPPREKTWGSELSVSVSHSQAAAPNAIAGLSVTFTGGSGATSK